MTFLDRIRPGHRDPYGPGSFHGARRGGSINLAIGVPLTLALLLVVTLTFAAMRAGARPSAASGGGHGGLQSLLIPSPRAPHAGDRRVVMTSNATDALPAAKRAASGRVPAVAHHHGVSYRTDANGYRIAPAADAALVPSTTYLAHLEGNTKGYPSAHAFQSNRTVPGAWYGYPSILPIVNATPDRLRVRLAQRPDESMTWINRNRAVITRTHYAVVVDLSQHWLYVFKHGIQLMSFPVGNGAPGTPTPTGTYFVAFHAPPTNSGYGPVMLETSAHSRVIARFEGGDDAIIAIHGPVGSDSRIGDHGAAISNGCIRMHNYDLRQVRHVHNGTPVFLTS